MKEKILVSSCLLGHNVKYDGKNNKIDLKELEEKYELIPFCPEVEGGLPIPRIPSEIVSFSPLKVINKKGEDVTDNFLKGAKKCVEVVKKYNIKKALLKSKSPSCGKDGVYDGTFSKNIIKKDGVSVMFLKKENVEIFDETQIDELLAKK